MKRPKSSADPGTDVRSGPPRVNRQSTFPHPLISCCLQQPVKIAKDLLDRRMVHVESKYCYITTATGRPHPSQDVLLFHQKRFGSHMYCFTERPARQTSPYACSKSLLLLNRRSVRLLRPLVLDNLSAPAVGVGEIGRASAHEYLLRSFARRDNVCDACINLAGPGEL